MAFWWTFLLVLSVWVALVVGVILFFKVVNRRPPTR